jgi:hypothetical protein
MRRSPVDVGPQANELPASTRYGPGTPAYPAYAAPAHGVVMVPAPCPRFRQDPPQPRLGAGLLRDTQI